MCYQNCNYSNIIYLKRATKAMLLIKFYFLQENAVLVSKLEFIHFYQSSNKDQCFFSYPGEMG